MRPSALQEVYWSHSLNDLKKLTSLQAQRAIITSMAFTESLMFTAGQIFGKQKKKKETIGTVDDALAFAQRLNALG